MSMPSPFSRYVLTCHTTGVWDEEYHRSMYSKNKPDVKHKNTQVTHYYKNGDVCDKTGSPREVYRLSLSE